jgi:hypothetical protein
MSVIVANWMATQEKNHKSYRMKCRELKEGDWTVDWDQGNKRFGTVAMKVLKITPKTIQFRFVAIHRNTDYGDDTVKNKSIQDVVRFKLYPKIPHYIPTGSHIIANGKRNDLDAFMFTHWMEHPVFDSLKTIGKYIDYLTNKSGKRTLWDYGDFLLLTHQTECVETMRCLVRTKLPLEIKYLITEWL